MRFADQALATLIPRILGRRRVCHVRRGQSCVRRGCDRGRRNGLHQVRKWTDGAGREEALRNARGP